MLWYLSPASCTLPPGLFPSTLKLSSTSSAKGKSPPPTVILLHIDRHTRTTGLSPDYVYVNPIGFLALSIWSWGVYFSPLARQQYQARHNGHDPQISNSDLAFSLHAFIASFFTLLQLWYYAYFNRSKSNGESRALLPSSSTMSDPPSVKDTAVPSKPIQLVIYAIAIGALISAVMVWAGRIEWLDWLYFASSIKLVITFIKYIPQVILNWRLKSVEGFAIGTILMVSVGEMLQVDSLYQDLTGSILSFTQLVVSSVFIEHDASGIIANPAKLGLALLSPLF